MFIDTVYALTFKLYCNLKSSRDIQRTYNQKKQQDGREKLKKKNF
jgi:hypothetical protein